MKKFISILMVAIMMLTAFTVSAYAQNSDEGDFYININGGSEKVVIDWDDFSGADYYTVSINTATEYHCIEETVAESYYHWVPDYSVTPDEVFDVTVYAYDKSDALVAVSNVVQVYIMTYMCDNIGIYGDVDTDQMVSVMDATYVQRKIAKAHSFDNMQQEMADVDNDELLSVMDATYIQQFCAGIHNSDCMVGYQIMFGWAEYEVYFDKWWE